MAVKAPCEVCLTPSENKCSGCQQVHYCSRDHQKQHWKKHKQQCVPVRVKELPRIGRYLEATRAIKAGDVIMKETPLITGPAQVTPPVCLGCYVLLEDGKIVSCEKCGWPFCSKKCTDNSVHFPECFYTQQRGEKVSISTYGIAHPNYQCITALRCLYQRDHNQKLWTKLQALESHDEDRKDTDKWENDRKMIAKFIWKVFKLEATFSEEEIMKCCGIIQKCFQSAARTIKFLYFQSFKFKPFKYPVRSIRNSNSHNHYGSFNSDSGINGHEVPLLEPEYVAVFDKISMVEHNCKANCNKSFTSDGEIILSAGVSISRGSHITVCYTDPLWGTEARRHHLSDSKFFECSCDRCSDVTELGTMLSAVKCKKKDCKGYLLPDTFVIPILHKTKSPDPNTRGLDNKFWKCKACKDEVTDAIIQQLLQDIGREMSVMQKGDPDGCERFIDHCASYLHPSHYYMVDAGLALAQLVGQNEGLAASSSDRLLLKIQLCRKITDLLETLAPAETRVRGSLLFELHAAVAESGRRKGLIDGPHVMLGYVMESRKILLESVALLAHEPPELPEGRLGRQAKVNLVQMDELIKKLSAALPSPL